MVRARGLLEPSQTLKMAKRPVTRDTVSISAKPPKGVARDGRIDQNGTVEFLGAQILAEEAKEEYKGFSAQICP